MWPTLSVKGLVLVLVSFSWALVINLARGSPVGYVDLSDDLVYVDPQSFAVVANLTTVSMLTDWLAYDNVVLAKAGIIEGVLFQYDQGLLPDLIGEVDHVLLFPIKDVGRAAPYIEAIMHPRIKATLVYPSAPEVSLDMLAKFVPIIRTPCVAISSEVAAAMINLVQQFQRDPVLNLTTSGDSSLSTPGPGDIERPFHRVWTRLYPSPYRPLVHHGLELGSGVVVACVIIPAIFIGLIVAFWFFIRRRRRLAVIQEEQKRNLDVQRRQHRAKLRLQAAHNPSTLPPLTAKDLHSLPVVTYSETRAANFRLCTAVAINRFRKANRIHHRSSYSTGNRMSKGTSKFDEKKRRSLSLVTGDTLVTLDSDSLFTAQSIHTVTLNVPDLDSHSGEPNDPPQTHELLESDTPADGSSRPDLVRTTSYLKGGYQGPKDTFEAAQNYDQIVSELGRCRIRGPAQCPVCDDTFEYGETLRMLPCGHAFHRECVDHWLTSTSATCPLCWRHVASKVLTSKTDHLTSDPAAEPTVPLPFAHLSDNAVHTLQSALM